MQQPIPSAAGWRIRAKAVPMTRGSLFVLCKRCHQRQPKAGGSVRFVLGLRRHVCWSCAGEIDRAQANSQPLKRAA